MGGRGRGRGNAASQPARPVGPGVIPRVQAPPSQRGLAGNIPPAAPAADAIQRAEAADADAARAGLADLARASQAQIEDVPGGEGGVIDADADDVGEEPRFSVECIPVSGRSGEHARLANEGSPEFVFDKNGVSFLLTNFSRHCYSCS